MIHQLFPEPGGARMPSAPHLVPRDHVAISALFDLVQQDLRASERQDVLAHLTVCPECVQIVQDLLHTHASSPGVLVEVLPLTAATPPAPGPEDASREAEQFLMTEDEDQTVHFLRSIYGDVTLLAITVRPEHQRTLEHKRVRVYDATNTLLCEGQILGGAVSWQLSGVIMGPLQVRYDETMP